MVPQLAVLLLLLLLACLAGREGLAAGRQDPRCVGGRGRHLRARRKHQRGELTRRRHESHVVGGRNFFSSFSGGVGGAGGVTERGREDILRGRAVVDVRGHERGSLLP